MITTLAVSGYRSLRDVVVPLGALTVVTGGNGSGKSSLYRALRLLAQCGEGRVVGSIAREGGLQSVLWAGPEALAGARRGAPVEGTVRKGPISLRIGYAAEDFGYLVDLGLPRPTGLPTAFQRDPELKRELIFSGPVMRPSTTTVRRRHGLLEVRDGRSWVEVRQDLAAYRSMLREYADPQVAPEVFAVREQIRSWRFYDSFRVDVDAPARRPQVGTRTPVLSGDGSDLAAAVQTILENGFGDLERAVADAFDGARPQVVIGDGVFDVAIAQPGMLRPLRAAELSDGTLRYLLLATALLSVDPPSLLVLNEPETSLHPSLIAPLARLIVTASRRSQIVVVSHSDTLIDALRTEGGDVTDVVLTKSLGETVVDGQGLLSKPSWEWGSR
jgi:predicted ATPase